MLRNRYFLLADALLLLLGAFATYMLRLDRVNVSDYLSGILLLGGSTVVATIGIFYKTNVYGRMWRYAATEDMLLLTIGTASGVLLGGCVSLIIANFVFPDIVVPRSAPFIYLVLAIWATAGPRLLFRSASKFSVQQQRRRSLQNRGAESVPALIVGAGDAGAMIAREISQNPQMGLHVLGFVDDNPAKQGVRIYGLPVLGKSADLPRLVAKFGIEQTIIAMPTASGKVLRQVMQWSEQSGARARIIPGIYEILDGKVNVSQLRNIQIEDLLRREPVVTDTAGVQQLLRGKRVLVTGGGGSIGSELCRQILRCQPEHLIVFGHGENSVFEIENELNDLRAKMLKSGLLDPSQAKISAIIGDLRHANRVNALMGEYRPQVIFHAAAHKHVPLMERNAPEAITNNVIGTQMLVNAAVAHDVEKFVMISSDKAVNPTTIMGASKRIAEMVVMQAANQRAGKKRAFSAVRFGNVLGSRGSVVLTFRKQIAAGGPVTVTHPDMERFFMTIPEAVQLVLQAGVMGQGGEIFVLDMGEPVKILDLARTLIELSGLQPGRDIDIAFTGIRPGEKLYEELFLSHENYERTRHEKIFIATNSEANIPAGLNEAIIALTAVAERNDSAAIRKQMGELIPEMSLN
ncbi:MAG: polysaccharide biosynthesis protein [Anaerolineae bacterium]|nr:polysaccharide biosynthesis protein [Anaerolineae bacterium]